MKILIVHRDSGYGVSSVADTEIKRLLNNPLVENITLISPKKFNTTDKRVQFIPIANIGKTFITKELYFAFESRLIIEKTLKKQKFDFVYTHSPFFSGKFNKMFYWKVHSLHRSYKLQDKSLTSIIGVFFHQIYSIFDFLTIKFADRVIFVSQKTLQIASNLYPKYQQKFFYMPNLVDPKNFGQISRLKVQNFQKTLKLPKGKNILFVGRLEPGKGIKDLIEAITAINDMSINLLVVGDGILRDYVKSYKFVKFIGRLDNNQLSKYYNLADLFVLPSHFENFPMTVIEAVTCQCLTLASNQGDVPQMLTQECVYSSNVELVTKIKALLTINDTQKKILIQKNTQKLNSLSAISHEEFLKLWQL